MNINYKIVDQSIILFEIRPSFRDTLELTESHYAKTTYMKSKNSWKDYWMRGSLNWTLYEPGTKVKNLQAFLKLVGEDKFHCFKG